MDRLNEKFNITDKDMLNNKNYYIFKLTYRNNKNISESILDFIYKKYDIKILNIDSNLSSYMITKFQTNNIFTTNIYDNNSYKICIIRNPYERIIEYFYKIETKYSISNLNNFIMNDLNESSLIEQSKYLNYCNICLSYKNITCNLNYLLNIFNKDQIELKINIYKLKEEDISQECKCKIKKLFPNDFKLWNSIKLKNIIFKY
jgi:NAD-specific glutamate dehydrogenase